MYVYIYTYTYTSIQFTEIKIFNMKTHFSCYNPTYFTLHREKYLLSLNLQYVFAYETESI